MDDQNQRRVSERDQELEDLLAPMRRLEAKSEQLASWRGAIQSVRTKKRVRWYQVRHFALPQIAAALLLGVLIGAVTFSKKTEVTSLSAENQEPGATIEYKFAKAD